MWYGAITYAGPIRCTHQLEDVRFLDITEVEVESSDVLVLGVYYK